MRKLWLIASAIGILTFVACHRQKHADKTVEKNVHDKVVHHGDPDQAKLDSIKAAKTKAKKARSKQ